MPALRIAAMLPLGLAAFCITSTRSAELGLAEIPLTLLCVATPVWFWMFTEAIFDDDFRLGPRHAWVLAAVWIVGGWHELVQPPLRQAWVHGLYTAMVIALLAWPPVRLLRQRAGDLVEVRRRWRAWFVAGVAIYGFAGIALMALFGGQLPADWARVHVAMLFVASLVASLALAQSGVAEGPSAALPSGTSDIDEAATTAWRRTEVRQTPAVDEALVRRIVEAMEGKRIYRTENMTVAALARAVGSQEYLVRRAINRGIGYRNFNDFLHHYRLSEAAPRLLSQPQLPVLSIALDVGYGSIGPFNRAFRQRFGMTPTAYRSGNNAKISTRPSTIHSEANCAPDPKTA
ncbi:MAG: helix-turn-helix transcriptional regulator [Betaproteobacteria bacterium]|nr:helix-turn-helix transcriptional regulator [Betaproteobacteria bacterium]